MRETYVYDLPITIRLLPKSSTPLGALAQHSGARPPFFIPMVGSQKGGILHLALESDTAELRAQVNHIVAFPLFNLAFHGLGPSVAAHGVVGAPGGLCGAGGGIGSFFP